MTNDLLSARALNRATLARQMLLQRTSDMSPLDAIGHLVGMQAQLPLNPYVGLWSRLERFDPGELSNLLIDRKVVRTVVMRATLHLVTADDCLTLRPLMQPVLDRELTQHRDVAPGLRGVDLRPVLNQARELLSEQPRTGAQLRAALAERFPELDATALAYACRNHVALVQVPPRGVWGRSGQVSSTTAEAWLGRPLDPEPSIDRVVLRYLSAYGPSTVADVAAWCRLTAMREVVDRLRPGLRVFRDERGRELFDIPDAPRPDPETPAPPRFLPDYDNAMLSHADRSRFISEDDRKRLSSGLATNRGSLLVDGLLAGRWHIATEQAAGTATLMVEHLGSLPKRASSSVAVEARRLLRFMAADAASHDVHINPLA